MLIHAAGQHRDLWVWSGDPVTIETAAWHYIADSAEPDTLWLGSSSHTPAIVDPNVRRIDLGSARHELGGEYVLVVANVCEQFDSDAIAAISGTLVGGGQLILLTPALENWAQADTWHLRRFIDLLTRSTDHCTILDLWNCPLPDSTPGVHPIQSVSALDCRRLTAASTSSSDPTSTARFSAQQTLIRQLFNRVTTDNRQVMLLTADRGRGKSAALGQLLARLKSAESQSPINSILISAPSRRSTDILFQHYDEHQPEPRPAFCPPDQLLDRTADLLIVDEAASIPLALLRQLVGQFKQIIFASTVHGYEGGGRGFALRFAQLLQRDGIKVVQFSLSKPIRWLEHDPLEAFCHSAFLLEAPLPPTPTTWSGDCANLRLELVTREQLATEEDQLAQIYGLLIQAHYRTTPNDLRYMLDNAGLRTFVLRLNRQIVAAALVTDEGPITDIALRQDILAKRRRPAGHRLPQLLSQYTLMAEGMDLTCARIVRIAVHPLLQNQGIGSTFLTRLREHYALQDYDLLGALFGAVPDTVRFWMRNAFTAVHQGFKPQTSSGYRSMTVASALGNKGTMVLERARLLHEDTQCFRGGHELADPDASTTLTAAASVYDDALLQRYRLGQRSFHDSHVALARLGKTRAPSTNPVAFELLRRCADPTTTIRSLVSATGASSQAVLESQLRQLVDASQTMSSAQDDNQSVYPHASPPLVTRSKTTETGPNRES